jgi:Na+-translocating ferredoxin:NAD+ oxidoreductase RnfD subunit
MSAVRKIFSGDPRMYQIATLAGLLIYGIAWLDFDVSPLRAALLLGTALATQLVGTRLFRLPAFDPRSPTISALSLCLLLRTNSHGLAAAAAVAAIGSKFLLRWNGKHLFNPTNFGIVVLMLATGGVWVSPAQWGNAAFFGFLLACAGGLVVNRAARSDVTFAFLAAYVLLVVGRSLSLGEPLAIPIHRLESGALLIFAFFMVSDPKTTPDSRPGRILFGALVAAGAAFVQFRLFRTNGPLWSLALFSLLVPTIDLLLPGRRYAWNVTPLWKGEPHAALGNLDPDPPLRPSRARGPRVLRVLRGQGRHETL